MCGTNVETSPVVLSTTVLSMLAAVLAVERDGGEGSNFGFFEPPKRAPLCGFTTHASRSHYRLCTHRTVKALQIAGSGLLASHELTEQELKIKNLTLFSFPSLSPASAATIASSWWEASSSMGNMYPCCFGPMLLALHARLEGGQIQGGLGQQRVNQSQKQDFGSLFTPSPSAYCDFFQCQPAFVLLLFIAQSH